ncbi:MAG: hypothetical protein WC312_04365 [Candidatus Omnitrophota bacterium]
MKAYTNKTIKIVLMFMLLGIFLRSGTAHALRPALQTSKLSKETSYYLKNNEKDAAKELPRTNPAYFDPDNFCFLVKSLVDFKYFNMTGKNRKLETLEITSVSCITQHHTKTLVPSGYILDVPDKNIIARYSGEVDSGLDKTEESLPFVLAVIEENGHKNLRTLKDVLSETPPDKYNEILIRMRHVRIIGMFYSANVRGAVKKKIKKEAMERCVPVIEIGKKSKIAYLPGQKSFLKQLLLGSRIQLSRL